MILVVGLRLGCLNHALLTREAIRSSGLPFAGWIANKMAVGNAAGGREHRDRSTSRFGVAPLGIVPRQAAGTRFGEPHPRGRIEAAKKLVSA